KKSGRKGFKYRYMDPVIRKRDFKTIYLSDVRDANKAMQLFLESREKLKMGLPDNSGWQLLYAKIVERFVKESMISSDARRKCLRQYLDANPLELEVGAELSQMGTLTQKCHALMKTHGEGYVRKRVQQTLKQMTTWAASVGIFPYDPLATWKKFPRTVEAPKKRAWQPDELRSFLDAADELDQIHNRRFPSRIIFIGLLITGNRPGVVLRAKIADLDTNRLVLPSGSGKKRNGMATIPVEFRNQLSEYLQLRDKPDSKETLFVTSTGKGIDLRNIQDLYEQINTYTGVLRHWPEKDFANLAVEPVEVAAAIRLGRVKIDGAPPRSLEKIAKKNARIEAIQRLAEMLRPDVERFTKGRPLYSLRMTHRMWASRFVNGDCFRLQCGWSSKEIADKNYFDPRLVDPWQSSKAVWEVLKGSKSLIAENKPTAMIFAGSAENVG
ncbi:MAG: hypothetical protein WCT04_03345, partial [Planctomycetota bacterium]